MRVEKRRVCGATWEHTNPHNPPSVASCKDVEKKMNFVIRIERGQLFLFFTLVVYGTIAHLNKKNNPEYYASISFGRVENFIRALNGKAGAHLLYFCTLTTARAQSNSDLFPLTLMSLYAPLPIHLLLYGEFFHAESMFSLLHGVLMLLTVRGFVDALYNSL